MATKAQLVTRVRKMLQDRTITDDTILEHLNEGLQEIAAGLRMPDGSTSPPLPDLYTSDTVLTHATNAFVTMPSGYQRDVMYIFSDANDGRIVELVSTAVFHGLYPGLDESGSVEHAMVKGTTLYYQGIPDTQDTLTIWFYQKPTDMAAEDSEPTGLPEHLHMQLLANYAAKECFALLGNDKKSQLYESKFLAAVQDMVDFVGDSDGEPEFIRDGFWTGFDIDEA